MHRARTVAFAGAWLAPLLAAAALADDKPAPAGPDPAAVLGRLVGCWETHGSWHNGKPLNARGEYTWGVNQKVLHCKTFGLGQTPPTHLYDSIYYYEPVNRRIEFISIGLEGSCYAGHGRTDGDEWLFDFEVHADGNVGVWRESLRFTSEDRYVWRLEQRQADGAYEVTAETEWVRQAAATP